MMVQELATENYLPEPDNDQKNRLEYLKETYSGKAKCPSAIFFVRGLRQDLKRDFFTNNMVIAR
jgi:hypothetical protein